MLVYLSQEPITTNPVLYMWGKKEQSSYSRMKKKCLPLITYRHWFGSVHQNVDKIDNRDWMTFDTEIIVPKVPVKVLIRS